MKPEDKSLFDIWKSKGYFPPDLTAEEYFTNLEARRKENRAKGLSGDEPPELDENDTPLIEAPLT